MRRSLSIPILLLAGLLAAPAPAEEPGPPEGAIAVHADFILDWSDVLSGGVERDDTARWLLDTGATFDLERIIGLRGATFFAGVQYQDGKDGSEKTGDIQAYSNIDLGDYGAMYAWWFEQRLMEDRLRIKVGRMDANDEFAAVETAGEFLNSSAGFSPTIHLFPTYPERRHSITFFFHPASRVTLGAGVYDSVLNEDPAYTGSRALFVIGSAGVTWGEGRAWRPGSVRIGAWRDTGEVPGFDGTMNRSPGGLYAIVEQELDDGLNLFAQIGAADGNLSEIARHYLLGIAAASPWKSREEDSFGIMATHVDLSDRPLAGFEEDETALELFYALQVNRHVRVKPDLQYILNPSGDPAVGDAVVGTIRIELSY